MAETMASAYPEMRETQPDLPVFTSIAKGLRKVKGYMDPEEDRGQTKLSDLLSIPALADTAERIGYGDRLTEGSGETLHLKPDTVEAKEASELLRQNDIPGHKYYAAGSRNPKKDLKDKHHNYVVYPGAEEHIQILEKK